MSQNDHENPLSTLLSNWQVSAVSKPQFRQGVWARIGQRKREAAWPSYLRAHAAAAASLAIIATVAGGVTGYTQAKGQARDHREAMVTAYVESIDVASQRSIK